jgi:hypothetical protein
VLAFTEHTLTSGGFACVPGFQKHFKQWGIDHPLESLPADLAPGVVPPEDLMQEQVCGITLPAGAMVIWDSRLPHQNYPNNDDTFRIVQYITYNRCPESLQDRLERKEKLLKDIETGFGGDVFPGLLTELGLKLVGLKDWDDETSREDFLKQLSPQKTPREQEALELLMQAQQAEADGDFTKAVSFYRRAFKLNPDLEALYQPSD